MIRKTLFIVGALALASAVQAKTIKRDIYGFEPGMTMEQVKAAAAKRGCALTPENTKSKDEDRYSCTRDDDPTTLQIVFGQRSNIVSSVALNFRNSLPVEKVKLDICKQYFADCSRTNDLMAWKPLDEDGDLVLQMVTPKDDDTLFTVTINSQHANSKNAEPKPDAVPEKLSSDRQSKPVVKRRRPGSRLASHADKSQGGQPAEAKPASPSLMSRLGVKKFMDTVRSWSRF